MRPSTGHPATTDTGLSLARWLVRFAWLIPFLVVIPRPAGAVVVGYSGQSATRASASFAGSLHGFALVAVGAGYSTLSNW